MDPRKELETRIWATIDPSIEGYSRMIDLLMNYMANAQLLLVLEAMDQESMDRFLENCRDAGMHTEEK